MPLDRIDRREDDEIDVDVVLICQRLPDSGNSSGLCKLEGILGCEGIKWG
jgi:hypothetical protein